MKAARAELEAAVAGKLTEAPSWLLVAVAEILANQPPQVAVDLPLRGGSVAVLGGELVPIRKPRATLKVADAGVTVTRPGRISNGLGPKLVREALASLKSGGTAADVLRNVAGLPPGVSDPAGWVRAHLQAGVKKGEFVRLDRGIYRLVQKASPKPVKEASAPTGVTMDKVWGLLRKAKGDLSPSDMAKKLGCQPRQLGAILGQLAKRGWVSRYLETGLWSVTAAGRKAKG